MKLAIIIPCYNEEEVLNELAKRLKGALTRCQESGEIKNYELIFVDDGSTDKTPALLRGIAQEEKKAKVISFSRNFGHQIAISAGIEYSDADAAIIMDADLQDPPEIIPAIVRKWKEGFKVVHMKRKSRAGEGLIKKILAKVFYRFINWVSYIEIPRDVGDFKLLDKAVVNYLKEIKEHHRFMRGLEVLAGFNQAILEYDREARFAGKPKYSFWKSFRLAIDGITSFSSRPLRIVTFLGVLGIISSICLTAYAIISKVMLPQKVLPGWTSLLISLTFFSGIQLFSLGLIGEYVGRIYEEVKNRPLYVVREKINC